MGNKHDDNQDARPSRRSPGASAILFVGSLGYLGFVPAASGTVAVAVVGVPLHWILIEVLSLNWQSYLGLVIAFTFFAIWIAGKADQVLGEQDSSRNVIDEIPGYLIALVGLPWTWQIVTAAFFLERALDIAKVWPANWVERHVPGGWGVVLDDVVAGIYTLLILHSAVQFLPPGWLGLGAS